MKLYGYIIASMILLMPCLAEAADIYRYIDDQGTERFVDRASAVPKQYRDQLETVLKDLPDSKRNTFKSGVATHLKRLKSIKQKFKSEKKVEIFITSWCPYCQKLEKFLKSRNIKYTRYDIEKDSKGKRLYKQLNETGIPITRVGSKIIRGFNTAAILKALGK